MAALIATAANCHRGIHLLLRNLIESPVSGENMMESPYFQGRKLQHFDAFELNEFQC